MGIVLPNRKIGRDGDTQPEFLRSLAHPLCLELAKPLLWAEHRDKCEGDTVRAGDVH